MEWASSRVTTGWGYPTHHREGREQLRRGGCGVEGRGGWRVQGLGRGPGLVEDGSLWEGGVQQVHALGVWRRIGWRLAHEADVGDAAGRHLGTLPGIARGLGLDRGHRRGLSLSLGVTHITF